MKQSTSADTSQQLPAATRNQAGSSRTRSQTGRNTDRRGDRGPNPLPPQALPDALAFAAWAQWRVNGHDIPAALLHVHRRHVDAAIRYLAGEAHDEVLRRRVLWDAFELDFAAREKDAR